MTAAAKLFIFCNLLGLAFSSHFRGAVIQWSPVNNNGAIEINHRIAWRRSFSTELYCDSSTISSSSLIGYNTDYLTCRVGCSGNVGTMQYYCTDFSVNEDWSAGERSYSYTFSSGVTYFEASYTDCCWISNLVEGADGSWEVRVAGSLSVRSDTGSVNNSPRTSVPPIVRIQQGCPTVITIPVSDEDVHSGNVRDDLRCRWASSLNGECGGVCQVFPGATLSGCSLQVPATVGAGWYAVALQVEDFATTSSTTPMSSVPIQFLVNVFTSSASCGNKPNFTSPPTPRDGDTFGIALGDTWEVTIIAVTSGPGVSIVDIVTVSPIGFMKSSLTHISGTLSWYIDATWTPTSSQAGAHIFCFYAEDSVNLVSDQVCVILEVVDDCDCDLNNGGCEQNCVCTFGGYYCGCNTGYTPQGSICVDIDECASNNGNCDNSCENTIGSYSCINDIDECATDNGNCEHVCANSIGSFGCGCYAGYQLSSDGRNCTASNKCDWDPCLNGGGCFQHSPMDVTCSCLDGFSGSYCEDDDINMQCAPTSDVTESIIRTISRMRNIGGSDILPADSCQQIMDYRREALSSGYYWLDTGGNVTLSYCSF